MTELPYLQLLTRGYLHQDWPQEHQTVWDAVDAFIAGEGQTARRGLADDARRLLSSGYSEDELRRVLIEELGSGYHPSGDGLTASQWLAQLAERAS